jgi:NADH-quinone oxidoreductase E subunit
MGWGVFSAKLMHCRNTAMEDLGIRMNKALAGFSADLDNLIPILQEVQNELGYISPFAVEQVANFLGVTESQVHGVASFYSQFRFSPRGRHSVTACQGTACHVRGGERLFRVLEKELGIKAGGCTADRRFDLNRVACLGCCALAPVVRVDEDIYSGVTERKLKEILDRYE